MANQDQEKEVLFSEALHRLCEQVRAQEDRQMNTDRRLVSMDSQLQAATEELSQIRMSYRLGQGPTAGTAVGVEETRLAGLEKGQRAVAAGVQRAMQLAMKSEEGQRVLAARIDSYRGGGDSAVKAAGEAVHEASVAKERVESLTVRMEKLQEARVDFEHQLSELQKKLPDLAGIQRQLSEQQKQMAGIEKQMIGQLDLESLESRLVSQLESSEKLPKSLDSQLLKTESQLKSLESQVKKFDSLETQLEKHPSSCCRWMLPWVSSSRLLRPQLFLEVLLVSLHFVLQRSQTLLRMRTTDWMILKRGCSC